MALVSGGKSTLNPNAPLFIPAAMRQVEDFSPEWYDLISTSTWFRTYWLTQHQEADMFYNPEQDNVNNGDIVDMLPDEIDLGIEDELLYMESQFQEFANSSQNQDKSLSQVEGIKKFDSPEASFPAGSKFAHVLPANGK